MNDNKETKYLEENTKYIVCNKHKVIGTKDTLLQKIIVTRVSEICYDILFLGTLKAKTFYKEEFHKLYTIVEYLGLKSRNYDTSEELLDKS